jgi:serine phosphatase RsbU (regulator of sigma subunit)
MAIATTQGSPVQDPSRLGALRRSGLLDSAAEESFDRITRIAASAIGVPVSLVSLVDEDRQFFKSCLGLPQPWADSRETPLTHSFCQHVVVGAEPLIISDAREHPLVHDNAAISDLQVIAYAGIPLKMPDGAIIGSLCAIDSKPREWSDQDIAMLRDLAEVVMTEIRLRLVAEEAADAISRLSRLEAITDAALSHLPEGELISQLLGRIMSGLQVDLAVVLLREGDHLVTRATIGLDEAKARDVRIPVGRGFAGRIAAEGRSMFLHEVPREDVLNPALRELAPAAMVGAPLKVDDEIIGVLHIGSRLERDFTGEDVDLLELAADRMARGISHSRIFEREHLIAQTLQRSALPAAIPDLPGLRAAVRYLPAGQVTHVGGDWYDVFAIGDGRAGLSVGDIAGHGISAAAEMGRIRSSLQAYLFESADPAPALERVDRLLLAGPIGKMATALAMTLDSSNRTALLSRAGHPPPVLLAPGAEPIVLDADGGAPLGVVAAPPRAPSLPVEFPVGATLVLYSDGLVERRGEPIDESIARLAHVAASAPAEVEELADHVLGAMLDGSAPADDVALLVVRSV